MKNVGSADKMIRIVVAVVLAVIAYMYAAELGVWVWAVAAVAVIALGTALLNFCPLYSIIGVKTCKTD